ncbi:helix-turn-helix domain-containing protein [Parvicella tangerina]|uniref:helix-turn-helix domain-containing protein n=1 Tax=Parvicella tangerina TaxID=2829795 RepID=UPI00215C1DF6|nr:helix-turn-helix transcriptional regulator [Parvicella tangerina]
MIDPKLLENIASIIQEEYPKYYSSKLAFAGAADVDEKTIRRILKGQQNISIEIFVKICAAIHISPSELLKSIGL